MHAQMFVHLCVCVCGARVSYIPAPQRVNSSSSCCRFALPTQRDLCAAATTANWTRIARFMAIGLASESSRTSSISISSVHAFIFNTFAGRINCIIDKRLTVTE